jgi:hypothetical protein
LVECIEILCSGKPEELKNEIDFILFFDPSWKMAGKFKRGKTHLKPSRNKKGLTFVGMLVFLILFLNFDQLPAAKKKDSKNEHPYKF